MWPCVVSKRFTPPQTAEVREMIHPSARCLEKKKGKKWELVSFSVASGGLRWIGSLGMKVIIQPPTHTRTLEPNCRFCGPAPAGRDTPRLATHCSELPVGGLVGCEREIFGRAGASLKWGLELIKPGLTVAVNTTNQMGGGLKLSFPLLCFSLCLCLLDIF